MVASRASIASKEKALSPGSPERKKGIRSKEGCLTCRIRRKKCDQGKQADSCESCRRLHIECLGYSRNRPEWLKVRTPCHSLWAPFELARGAVGGQGVKVEEFKRTIKRFLAENSPKSGLHARQDPSVPVPFLSFEGLRGRNNGATSSMPGPSDTDYSVSAGPLVLDQLADDSDGSDDEAPRHYQLQPLTKKEVPTPPKSPEPGPSVDTAVQPNDVEMTVEDDMQNSENRPTKKTSVINEQTPIEKQHDETNVAIDPAIVDIPDDPELLYYVDIIFPVLHELAGFNLSSQELLAFACREGAIRNALITQAKHHQNRMKFLTSTDGPHHQATQKLCLDLAASNNAYVSALGALSPIFERATRQNNIDMLAVLYTLLHFGGIGELLTRHIARRGNQGAATGSGFLLELSCRWLASSIAHFTDLASALRRGSDRQRAIIQAAIHIDIYSSIALCRPPHFLDSYRASFKHGDTPLSTDANGVRTTIHPRLDDLLDIPARTILALAEMSAMASWKAEHVRHSSLSVMDLSRWAKRIDALLAPPSPESILPPAALKAGLRPPSISNNQTKLLPVVTPVSALLKSSSIPPMSGLDSASSAPNASADNDHVPSRPPAPVNSGVDLPDPAANSVSDDSGSKLVSNVAASTGLVAPSSSLASASINPGPPNEASTPADKSETNTANLPNQSINTELEDSVCGAAVAPTLPQATTTPQHSVTPSPVDPSLRTAYRRTLPPATREVFRCAGRVFLHTILSGENPRVHDIVQAVSDTCGALRDLGLSYLPPGTKPTPTDDLRFPVVRGLPFCIFIAGCVAGSMEQGMFLRSCLRPVIREIDMQTAELLTAVLSERAGSGDAISWQSVMTKRGSRLVFM